MSSIVNNVDIKSLGWVIFGKGNYTFRLKTNTWYQLEVLTNLHISKEIILPDKKVAWITIFEGQIKNKKDLRKLMDQLLIN